MARMIPADGPNFTESPKAEANIYWRLSKQLPDDFTVIHSLPWLASAASEIDGRNVPTGEIDFLVLHPQLGIIAVEIKGGIYKYDQTRFVYLRTNKVIHPVQQIRRGTHGLARWIVGVGGPPIRIGYAILFPDSEMNNRNLPPAIIDKTIDPPQSIVLDRRDLRNLEERIIQIMQYWQKYLGSASIGRETLETVIDLICPKVDYRPSWLTRIEDDTRLWLRLTEEQADCLKHLRQEQRFAVDGRPGTGKTIIAISLARQLVSRKVLFLTYNLLLSRYLRNELSDTPVEVMTFHNLCRRAGSTGSADEQYTKAFEILSKAINTGTMPAYDALIIDEAQVFKEEWIKELTRWFRGKQIAIFGDGTQAFDFEESVPVSRLAQLIEASGPPFILTLSIRSPKAVFDRLTEIWPTTYQQYSLREYEDDTLEELFDPSPLSALLQVLEQLRDNQVPSASVTLLYGSRASSDEALAFEHLVDEGIVGRAISIPKFRGLESPFVIIWATGKISDVELFCAYSRATTKCIVIYDLVQVAARKLGQFGNYLLESKTTPQLIRDAALNLWRTIFVEGMQLHLTSVVTSTSTVFWSHDWGAWIVISNQPSEFLPAALWRDYLALHSKFPIFFWDSETYHYLRTIKPPLDINDDIPDNRLLIKRCSECGRWTPHQILSSYTYECEHHKQTQLVLLPEEGRILKNLDQLFATPEQFSIEAKKQVGPLLGTLGRYLHKLTDKQRSLLTQHVNSEKNRILYHISVILAGIAILNLGIGEKLMLKDFCKKHVVWFPELGYITSWKSTAALGLAFWIQRDWIVKEEKGVYSRQPIPGFDDEAS